MAIERQQEDSVNLPTGNRGGNKRWANLFRENSRPSKAFQLKKWNEGERSIAKDDLRNLGFCLVGYILGRFPGRTSVENVRKSWNVDSSCSLHENGWMIFRFNSAEDRDSVLSKGPYASFGAPWLLKQLPQFFKFHENAFTSVPTWIRLPNLPLDCWTEIALGKLASYVGVPIAADECTAAMSKTAFARILVEVEVSEPLIRKICARMPDGSLLEQDVLYEREPLLCSACKRLGHTDEQCRSISKKHFNAQQQMAARKLIKLPASSGHEQAVLQLSSVKGVEGSDTAGLPPAIPAAACAAEWVSPLPAMMVQRRADLQGDPASTLANSHTTAANHQQNMELKSAAMQQRNHQHGADAINLATHHNSDASLQAVKVINTSQVENAGQNRKVTRMASAVIQPAAASNLDSPQLPVDTNLKIKEQSSGASLQRDLKGNTPAKDKGLSCLQQPVEAPVSTPLMNQQLTEMQASPSSAAIAVEMVSTQLADKRKQMVDLQGGLGSSLANTTADTFLLDQGLISLAMQQMDESLGSAASTPMQAPVQDHTAAVNFHALGAVQEQTPQHTPTCQTRRQTRSSAAVNAAAMLVQPIHQGPATTSLGDSFCVQVDAGSAEPQQVEADSAEHQLVAKVTAVPKQQIGQKKWQTGKKRSGKQRR